MNSIEAITRREPSYYRAMRYCDEHDIRDMNESMRVRAWMAHRAFMESTEHLRAMQVKLSLCILSPGWIVHEDGRFEPMRVDIPPQVQATLDMLDEAIRAEAARHGVTLEDRRS